MMMAPLENVATGLASLGRFEDNYIVHASEGETVIPKEVLDANPKLKTNLFKQMKAVGIKNPESYIVGNELNSRNPVTGQPEFFFKGLKKFLPTIGAIVGNILAGPVGGAIGSGLGSLAGGQKVDQALVNAGLAFVGGKYVAPELDAAFMNPATKGIPTLGSVTGIGQQFTPAAFQTGTSTLSSGLGSALSGASATIPQVLVAGASPLLGEELVKLAQPPEVKAEGLSKQQIVDNYYAALARGENPEVPPELARPPQDSLLNIERTKLRPTEEDILYNPDYEALLNNVLQRKMFLNANTGGYITGPGGPRDDKIPTLLSNTEFVQTGKAVAGADPTGGNNPDRGAKVMEGIMRAFERRADQNARMA